MYRLLCAAAFFITVGCAASRLAIPKASPIHPEAPSVVAAAIVDDSSVLGYISIGAFLCAIFTRVASRWLPVNGKLTALFLATAVTAVLAKYCLLSIQDHAELTFRIITYGTLGLLFFYLLFTRGGKFATKLWNAVRGWYASRRVG